MAWCGSVKIVWTAILARLKVIQMILPWPTRVFKDQSLTKLTLDWSMLFYLVVEINWSQKTSVYTSFTTLLLFSSSFVMTFWTSLFNTLSSTSTCNCSSSLGTIYYLSVVVFINKDIIDAIIPFVMTVAVYTLLRLPNHFRKQKKVTKSLAGICIHCKGCD